MKFPLFDAQNDLYATCGLSTDVSERVQATAHFKEAQARFRGAFEQLMSGSAQSFQQELRVFNATGHNIWVCASGSIVTDPDGEPVHVILQLLDISERKRLEERLRHIADYDSLTGIRNRRLFEEDLHAQVGRSQRYGEQAALLMIDLDHFKQVNDVYGHKAGDDVLKAVAATLQQRLRETDRVGRLGSDEFAVLLPRIGRRQAEIVAADLDRMIAETKISIPGADLYPAPPAWDCPSSTRRRPARKRTPSG